jgi:hypothetical protein
MDHHVGRHFTQLNFDNTVEQIKNSSRPQTDTEWNEFQSRVVTPLGSGGATLDQEFLLKSQILLFILIFVFLVLSHLANKSDAKANLLQQDSEKPTT